MKVRDLTIMAMLTALLFAQEELLSFLPNIQLTFFLIILYSAALGLKRSAIIIIVHVLLDNLVMGTFSIFTIAPMLIGYLIITLVINLFKIKNNVVLAFLSILFSVIYALLYLPIGVYVYGMNLKSYIMGDIIFDAILVSTNFLLTLWLFKPLYKVLTNLLKTNSDELQKDNTNNS